MGGNQVGVGPVLRAEMGHPYQYYPYTGVEKRKRQLFLRSYQFCRKKKGVGERIRGSFFRVKRLIWVRIRSSGKIRKMLWFRLRHQLRLFFYASATSFSTNRKRRLLGL